MLKWHGALAFSEAILVPWATTALPQDLLETLQCLTTVRKTEGL